MVHCMDPPDYHDWLRRTALSAVSQHAWTHHLFGSHTDVLDTQPTAPQHEPQRGCESLCDATGRLPKLQRPCFSTLYFQGSVQSGGDGWSQSSLSRSRTKTVRHVCEYGLVFLGEPVRQFFHILGAMLVGDD